MMNYMRSECYRTLLNRSLWLLIGACGGLMAALTVVLCLFQQGEVNFPYGNTRFALRGIYMQMVFVLAVVVAFAGFYHDGEDKQHTIKHSVAFGIKRSTIFMGRFLVQAIVGAITFTVLVAVYTALSYLLLEHSNQGEWVLLLRGSIGSSFCLLSGVAITDFFLMNSENETGAYLKSIIVLFVLPLILNMLGRRLDIVKKISELFPYNVVNYDSPLIMGEGAAGMEIARSMLIGAIWMAAFLAVGIKRFQKKEMK